MRDTYGITIAGGQAHLKGKIVRIAHCGYYGAFDIIATIAALEMTLAELGADVTLGAGVSRAQQVFREAGVPMRRSRSPDRRSRWRTQTATASSSRRRSPTPGVELLREHFDVDVARRHVAGGAGRRDRGLRRDRDPLGHAG